MADDNQTQISEDELRQFIEQYEQLEIEKQAAAERQKEVMAEAKSRGFDTKIMKKIIALRKQDEEQRAEEEILLDLYKSALNMD